MTRAEQDDAWVPRPIWARVVCVFVSLAPISVGATAAVELSRLLPGQSTLAGTVLRALFVVVASTAAVLAVDRAARRLLPLAALYRLSLVFPDHAPSRFRTALKAGSSRRVERLVAETVRTGLPQDPGRAAQRVVELINAIGDHDRRTRGHSERVRLYADLIGEELHLSKEDRQKLQWAALLHDLGKLKVPGEILNKKGAPSNDEWHILRTHPAAGERLVAPLRSFLGPWADAVGGHHEWWNGTGYPRKLRGDQITQSAAIVAVADAYEVMTAVRSYKKSMPASAARAELTRAAGQQFSPDVVRAFLCVSLGKLRWAAGPMASLAQIPFLGSAVRIPSTFTTAIQGASSVASAAAPSMAAFMVATTAVASSIAVAPPAHKTHSAKTYAFAQTAAKKSGSTSSATTKAAGGGKSASAGAGAGSTTSITAGSGRQKTAADEAATTSDGKGDGSTVDTSPTTDTTSPAPVVTPVDVAIGDVSIPEGDSGTRLMSFPVTLSQSTTETVTVQYVVTGGTATIGAKIAAGVDFKQKMGTLTFTPGSSGRTPILKTVAVTINGDTDIEPNETFDVRLSDPTGDATLVRSVGTGTILDDDGIAPGITVGIGDAAMAKADNRAIYVSIPVWLSAPSVDPVSVGFTVDNGTATWSEHAKDGGDYGCDDTTGLLEFEPGSIVEIIQVKIWPDANPRPDRSFTISLTSSDASTTIVRPHGTFTILGN